MNVKELSFDDEMEEEHRQWEQEMLRLEKTISQRGHHDLNVLAKSGVDTRVLLVLLALAAKGDRSWMLRLMRQRQAALKSLSKRMDNLARETKQRVNDPLSVVQFWAYMNGGSVLGMQFPKTLAEDDPGAEFMVSGMRALAKILRERANKFGQYLRTWGKTDVGVVLLLVRYRMFCRKMNHLDELARLLTDAFEAAGKDKCFSAEGLRKTYKRRATRFIRLWLRFNGLDSPSVAVPPSPVAKRSIPDARPITRTDPSP